MVPQLCAFPRVSQPTTLDWRKSRRSGGGSGDCAEVSIISETRSA
jgi:hypothetical protein